MVYPAGDGENGSSEESKQVVRDEDSKDYFKSDSVTKETVTPCMLWNELEACMRQVSQVGVSACGATALINVLQALNMQYSIETVCSAVPTSLRAEKATLADYLLSRSIAGTSHQHLMDSMRDITNGRIVGSFFHFHPKRRVSLLIWLSKWLQQGAVPIATLNLQRVPDGYDGPIPDAWHHQMIFGVNSTGVFMTNPLEFCRKSDMLRHLRSASELLVRRDDVIKRWAPAAGEGLQEDELANTCGERLNGFGQQWIDLQVAEQVERVLCEDRMLVESAAGKLEMSTTAYELNTQQISDDGGFKHSITNPGTNQTGNPSSPPSPPSSVDPFPEETNRSDASHPSTSPVSSSKPTHVRIPAMYKAGITLYVDRGNNAECYDMLMACPELPIA